MFSFWWSVMPPRFRKRLEALVFICHSTLTDWAYVSKMYKTTIVINSLIATLPRFYKYLNILSNFDQNFERKFDPKFWPKFFGKKTEDFEFLPKMFFVTEKTNRTMDFWKIFWILTEFWFFSKISNFDQHFNLCVRWEFRFYRHFHFWEKKAVLTFITASLVSFELYAWIHFHTSLPSSQFPFVFDSFSKSTWALSAVTEDTSRGSPEFREEFMLTERCISYPSSSSDSSLYTEFKNVCQNMTKSFFFNNWPKFWSLSKISIFDV